MEREQIARHRLIVQENSDIADPQSSAALGKHLNHVPCLHAVQLRKGYARGLAQLLDKQAPLRIESVL